MVHGTRYYGKVEVVRGRFHVATCFFHIFFVPVMPLNSDVLVEIGNRPISYRPIDLNWKSILMAWTRTALLLFDFVFLVTLMTTDFSLPPRIILAIFLGVIAIYVATYFLPGISSATPERARILAERVGLPDPYKLGG